MAHNSKRLVTGFVGSLLMFSALNAGTVIADPLRPEPLSPARPDAGIIRVDPEARMRPHLPRILQPDLVIDDIYLDPACNVVVKVRNAGPGALPDEVWSKITPKSSGIYLTINGSRWGGASLWKIDPGRALQPPGGTAVYTSNLKVNRIAAVKAEVDIWNVVRESNEANNAKIARLRCQSMQNASDLSVSIAGCPQAVRPGQELGASFSVTANSTFPKPIGGVAVDLVLTSVASYPVPAPFAVYSPNYTNGVLLKGGREHISFAGPGSVPVKLNGSNPIPADTPPGDYFLAAVVDAGNRYGETNENNNVAYCRLRVLPPTGSVSPVAEDCVRFNPATIEVRQFDGRWKIVDGSHWVFDFGSNRGEADQAFRIIRHYGMNQSCFVGRPDPSFKYLLVAGDAPTGTFPGEDAVRFNPATIEVRQFDGRWKIVDGSHWIFDFGSKRDEAEQAFSIIKKYGFSSVCYVGRPDPSFIYLKK